MELKTGFNNNLSFENHDKTPLFYVKYMPFNI